MTLSRMVMAATGALLAASAGAFGMASAAQAEEITARVQQMSVETHPSQGDRKTIAGSQATLVRLPDGVFANLETKELTPGNAYTMWLVVLNEPHGCESSPCMAPDVLERSAKTKSDVGYGDGIVAASDGSARLSAFQAIGDLKAAWLGNGLHDPVGAEVHLVVHDHGPLLPELAETMLMSYRGGCTDDSLPAAVPETAKSDGKPGPNTCRLVQDVAFVPEK